MTIFYLTSENLTNLGGPMGSEYTYSNWSKPFETLEKAKAYAVKDYKGEIKWTENSYGELSSGDLNWVMYHIKETEVL
jgi:hypothetical protein